MMTCHGSLSLAAFALTVLTVGSPGFAADLAPTPDQFEKLRTLIKPHAGEDKWAEIPWMANLWEARRRAATEGKPILLWEMDGNPLGCG
jgi:hypothetical protein